MLFPNIRRAIMLLTSLISALPVFIAANAANRPLETLVAGAAKVDITPTGEALTGGASVRDRLYVRAIYLKSQGQCAVLVGIDKALVPTAVVKGVQARLGRCPPDNIIISATHTHSAGDLPSSWNDPVKMKLLEDAIVKAATDAARAPRKARMGFATTDLHLNVNRDAFDGENWYQGEDKTGASDKSMSVLYFVDEKNRPIGLMMNYGMHPINFHLSGVISADFPGEAAAYVERRFPDAIAMFTQAASGDQNPLLSRPLGKLMGPRLHVEPDDGVRQPTFWELIAKDARDTPGRKASPPPAKDDWTKEHAANVASVGEIVTATGAIMGETAIEAMRDRSVALVDSPQFRSAALSISCPGRDRLTTDRREGLDPGYKDGDPVKIRVGLLRLGEVALFGVDSELYTEIVQHLKKQSPASQTAVIGLANGLANSGYIYSDNAAHHLTFQVVGSRLKAGCAEKEIIRTALKLFEDTKSWKE